ncbi:TIGR02678 family protein [Paenibacillus sp. PK4536]|uniref:TIGR02678 family protein n=1 Tax=Paenibacillus sp. PK4536 TaxID=3024576 RepID=UPI002359B5A2|nr:TIGR02678 family protein [Paenibacillus sp. PK4536]WIM40342.1 TIGR02678 family protein [Paenibacillus sp. PK4536]
MERIKVGKLNREKRRHSSLISKEEQEERKLICMNALLNRTWITKELDPQLYYWIKEKQPSLKEWFMDFTGYSLFVNAKLAKLEKIPAVAYSWMGFQEFREPLDYVLFTYSLWFLENKLEQEQFLLTTLVKEIREYMTEQNMIVDWKNYYHRLSMGRALKKLKGMNIVQAVDGQELHWTQNNESNVLYECTPYSRYILRNFPKPLTQYTSMDQLSENLDYGNESEGQKQRKKHYLYRRYLLEPIVQDEAWNDDSLYFHGQRNNVLSQIKKMFGWEGSRYREGTVFFEPELTSEAEIFPTLSAISDLTLLVCGVLRDEALATNSNLTIERDGIVNVTLGEIERILTQLQNDYKKYWTNEYNKKKPAELAVEVLNHLIEWGFGEWKENGLFALYAIGGRWAAKYGTTELEI